MTNEVINKLYIYADAFNQIRDVLNECDRRHFLAETAIRFGYGAMSILSQHTGVAISTIRRGITELSSQGPSSDGHIRSAGAGRKPVEQIYPDLIRSVQEILEDELTGLQKAGNGRPAACGTSQRHWLKKASPLKRAQYSGS